jgi:predicted nucleic acid-binding protein
VNIVLDASVAVRALLSAGETDRALRERVRHSACHAPHLVDAEVGSVLRRRVAAGAIDVDSAAAALRAVKGLITDRYPHTTCAEVAWTLRNDATYYDALYVALAARLGYPLLTADARLARAPRLPCAVELID